MKTKRINPDDLELKDPGTPEEETKVLEPPLEGEEGPVYSSGRSGDLEEENIGRVQLKCLNCELILSLGRMEDTNISCPKCGSHNFLALSNFRMVGPEKEKTVRVGEIVLGGGGPGAWKLV
jgi:DNA-directed RNA polymerase subunit RPC12/RpoP